MYGKVMFAVLLIIIASCGPGKNKLSGRFYISAPIEKAAQDSVNYSDLLAGINPGFSLETLSSLTKIDWQIYATNDSIINFTHLFSGQTDKIVYVIEEIEAEREQTKYLSLGSDDGMELFVNGEKIYSVYKGRSIQPNDDFVKTKLNKGKNVIIYKIDQGYGGWALFRKFISLQVMNGLLEKKAFEIYSDILDKSIITYTAGSLKLNLDNRMKADSIHTIIFSWKNIIHPKQVSNSVKYHPFELPDSLKLPANFKGKILLEMCVVNKYGEELLKELYPIFSKIEAEKIFKAEYSARADGGPIFEARKFSVESILKNEADTTLHIKYSTRIKAWAAFDYFVSSVFEKINDYMIPGPRIFGYRSAADNSIQTYRIFIPSNSKRKWPVVFSLRGVYTKPQTFWESYEGKTHYLLASRNAIADAFNSIIVMPHGRGVKNYLDEATEELPLILKQLQQNLNIDTNKIAIFSGSSGPMLMLNLLEKIEIHLNSVGFMSPILPNDNPTIQNTITELKKRYPRLRFFIRHGLDDSDAPINITRRWIRELRNKDFEADYKEIPHSTHWNFINNPEAMFMKYLKR